MFKIISSDFSNEKQERKEKWEVEEILRLTIDFLFQCLLHTLRMPEQW